MTTTQIELIADGKSFFVSEEEAERELGIAHGDRKEVKIEDLVAEGEKLPLFVIRPHQTLVITASQGKLAGCGSVGGGRLLKGTAVDDGAVAHYRPDDWCKGAQGNGNSWVYLSAPDGSSKKMCFGYMITKN